MDGRPECAPPVVHMKIAPPTEHPVPAWQITPWLQIHGITCHPASRVEFFSSLLERNRLSVRPGAASAGGKIIRIRHARAFVRHAFEDLVGNAFALAIGDRLFLGGKAQPKLLLHI